jgi:hypothetical protein
MVEKKWLYIAIISFDYIDSSICPSIVKSKTTHDFNSIFYQDGQSFIAIWSAIISLGSFQEAQFNCIDSTLCPSIVKSKIKHDFKSILCQDEQSFIAIWLHIKNLSYAINRNINNSRIEARKNYQRDWSHCLCIGRDEWLVWLEEICYHNMNGHTEEAGHAYILSGGYLRKS